MTEKEYYKGLVDILYKQFEGNATWTDVVNYREQRGIKTTYDYVQRGSAVLMELMRAGYNIVSPDEDKDVVDVNNTAEYNKDGTFTYQKLISISELENVTPELIMEKHGLDSTKWECISYKTNLWSNGQRNEYGEREACYQSKVTVKPKKNPFDIEEIKKYFETYVPKYSKTVKNREYNSDGENLFVPCFYDVHFGKLAYEPETGENYDVEIAEQRFKKNSDAYISRIKDKKVDRILYVIGQDFIHSEPNGKTVNNTPQDIDGRYQRVFKHACKALIDSIVSFSDIAPVDVVLIQGNHGETSEFFLAEFLWAYFRNDPNVTVDDSPMLRKYYRYGNNLIGLSHGEYEGKRIAELMPVEAREDWGETQYHEFLLGHLHHESSSETAGLTVRRIPSMCGTDAWSKKMGYCTSPKRTVAFLYNNKYGLTETMYQVAED